MHNGIESVTLTTEHTRLTVVFFCPDYFWGMTVFGAPLQCVGSTLGKL